MIDPLGLLPGDELPVRVRFDGPALAGAAVRLLHRPSGARDDDVAAIVEAISDSVGTVVLPIGGPGAYLVTTEHRIDRGDQPPELHQAALTFVTGGKR